MSTETTTTAESGILDRIDPEDIVEWLAAKAKSDGLDSIYASASAKGGDHFAWSVHGGGACAMGPTLGRAIWKLREKLGQKGAA